MTTRHEELKDLATIDVLKEGRNEDLFVGHPFKLDYSKTNILTCDRWKFNAGGIPQGCFLLAYYENDFDEIAVEEALLLRAINPCPIPSDNDVIRSRIDFYKEDADTSGRNNKLDQFTRFEFSFSGLECSILGTFYKDANGKTEFGADVENYYSAHLYKVYKLSGKALKYVANLRDTDGPLKPDSNFPIGKVRYSSSKQKFSTNLENTEETVLMHTKDILGKRTALFGMTRTGKSNTVKVLIQATEELSSKSKQILNPNIIYKNEELDPLDSNEVPKYKVGQIIFDINGEYANKNLQDEIAIFEKYKDKVIRYSVLEKVGFEVLKINFFEEITSGLELLRGYFNQLGKQSDYVDDFLGISLDPPDSLDTGEVIRYGRKVAAYKCCLIAAGFPLNGNNKIAFRGNPKELDSKILVDNKSISPEKGITYDEAIIWFSQIWKYYEEWDYLKNYETKKGHPWADNDLKAILRFLVQYRNPNEKNRISGFTKLRPMVKYHTPSADKSFDSKIIETLRKGEIVIVDLSQGDPEIQKLYSERICQVIFNSSMKRFIDAQPNNFIQFYFEEAHNLFPQKEDKDLSKIYNRLAKEGAKLQLGMSYATQEVSSISSNILKNTQNWFIAHLNNEDEIKELRKFYDFDDFSDSLIRFSAKNDKGFIRMKTYSNPFVVPVQVELFK